MIYSGLFQYFHPGVAPWEPAGYVIDLRNGFFFQGQEDIFLLEPAAAIKAVSGSIKLQRNFAFNMQAFVFERGFLEGLRKEGKVFHSLFPDYYLANVAMAFARSVVAGPKPITIAGVSRKSYGYTLFNRLDEEGDLILNTNYGNDEVYKTLKPHLLPGRSYNSNYLITMHHVLSTLGSWSSDKVDVERYRKLQIFECAANIVADQTRKYTGEAVVPLLNTSERIWMNACVDKIRRCAESNDSGVEIVALRANIDMYAGSPYVKNLDIGSFASLSELFNAMSIGTI